MQQPLLSRNTYLILFSLLFVVYLIGLFVPLMDNDSAHHATIALRMYLTGDYVNLVDNGKDYLDKPHLHFWLSALSYHIFGVTSFAYKFPSFLFTILGTWSTYRLGRALYHSEVGRLAALITASAFGYILANNDVRMDAILTGAIIFATWQLVEWVQHQKLVYALGGALGLALGFCTKGHIAVFTPGVALLFYLLYTGRWKVLFHWQFVVLVLAFLAFILPVVYCYYLQYDLHPEKVIRGKSGRSGVAFILWQQNFERFQGDSFGADAKNDYFFFLHSFLWAFAPWSILCFVAFVARIRNFNKYEWLTIGTFAVVGLLISFSGFKLPHYLNIIFPISAVLTASYLYDQAGRPVLTRRLLTVQALLCILCLLAAGAINLWAFPVHGLLPVLGFFVLLAAVILLFYRARNLVQQLVTLSAAATLLVFYLLNSNFYPQLLTYQGGNQLAFSTKGKVPPQQVYYWPGIYSSSYNYYTAYLHATFHDSLLRRNSPVWVLSDAANVPAIEQQYPVLERYEQRDYEITRLKLKFINPSRRKEELNRLVLLRIR